MDHALICPLCSKYSSNKRAHIRHTSYCRKKAEKPLRSRKRSCLPCIKAKSYCDLGKSSSCSRCTQKRIDCKPPPGAQEDRALTTISGPGTTYGDNNPSSSVVLKASRNEALLTDWGAAMISYADLTEPQSGEIEKWLSSDQWSRTPDFFALGPQLTLQLVRAFTPRVATWGSLSLLGRYVTQMIRQYPSMILSGREPPPFIHYQCLKHSEPGPLARCAGIVELWQSKTPKNAPYLWKILRMEQERLMQEIPEYGNLAAVNALQAITIYFLLRAFSTDDKGTNFDVALIQTMTQLGIRTKDIMTAYHDPDSPSMPEICSWVMSESLRRTVATLFIVELLFDISPGMIHGRCNSLKLWSAMLLPCGRLLWEAETQAKWADLYNRLGDERPHYGELLQHDSLDYARSGLLGRWMANVDDFGKLIISIASVAELAC